MGRKQPLLDLWSGVVGEVPPFAGAERYERDFAKAAVALDGAHACFRGVKRPVGNDDNGFDVFAFVTKPTKMFTFEPSLGCSIKLRSVPNDVLLVSYARIDYANGRPYQAQAATPPEVAGVVFKWEFVEADPVQPRLPIDYQERYRQRKW